MRCEAVGVPLLKVLAAALAAAIAELGVDPGWASLIVGDAFLIIGIVVGHGGEEQAQGASQAPTRAAKNVQRNARSVKGTATDDRRVSPRH